MMDTKEAVRKRREEKIRRLMEQPVRDGFMQERLSRVEYSVPAVPPSYPVLDEEERDPEKLWKESPNPWDGWTQIQDDQRSRTSRIDYRYRNEPGEPPYAEPPKGGRPHPFFRELRWKMIAAAVLFAGIWGLYQTDEEWALESRTYVAQALHDELDFASAAKWYKETFAGAPTFIPIFQEEQKEATAAEGTVKLPIVAPLEGGAIVRTFAELLNGVELAGSSEEAVNAVETGRVLVVSEPSDDGVTVVVQHADERVSVYGKLGYASVGVNDWVEAGDQVGSLRRASGEEPSLLYFAIKQNDRYIDPVSVIPLG
ncbi:MULTISPECIES: M23 family metallopeptidase [unclassified Paenibacillus]|nr:MULTISPECIES: M23 family metallopeptidase [unclassified Paenibacillus]